MSSQDVAEEAARSADGDYAADYYNQGHLGADSYDWESEEWRGFFRMAAERIVGITDAHSTLDVGCAKGLLVQALVEKGVDAHGFDVSDYAVQTSHLDVRKRLWVASATEPIEGRYDLITCVEVLEHMSAEEAQRAIDAMCAATDLIFFSSTPSDFEESTHINVHPTAQWAAWFAERGFFRRVDVDPTFLTSWAVFFERADLNPRSVVQRYEAQFEPLNREVIDKRQALLELNRQVTAAQAVPRAVELDDESLLARHEGLLARDAVMGLEARIATLTRELATARARVQRLRARVEDRDDEISSLRGSRTWKVGRAATAPLRRLRG